MEIIQSHFNDAFRDGHTCGFLHRLGVVLEKEQGKREGSRGGNHAPGNGFGQVAKAGFFSGH